MTGFHSEKPPQTNYFHHIIAFIWTKVNYSILNQNYYCLQSVINPSTLRMHITKTKIFRRKPDDEKNVFFIAMCETFQMFTSCHFAQKYTHKHTHFALEWGIMCTLVVTHYLANKLIHGIFAFLPLLPKIYWDSCLLFTVCVRPILMLLTNLVECDEKKKMPCVGRQWSTHKRFTNFESVIISNHRIIMRKWEM